MCRQGALRGQARKRSRRLPPGRGLVRGEGRLTPETLDRLAARIAGLPRRSLVGIAGSQGSGKSTLATALSRRLPRCALISLDDFYLGRDARALLARTVHPLLATRGVPGTHDLPLLEGAVDSLLAGGDADLPRFDKTADDRASEPRRWRGPADVVLLEGWCVGARPDPAAPQDAPLNSLEAEDDPDGCWRGWVEARLMDYQRPFARVGLGVFLRAPSFEVVAAWRAEQEAGLARTPTSRPAMDAAAIARFVAHYERITRRMIADPPTGVVIQLDETRRPVAWREAI